MRRAWPSLAAAVRSKSWLDAAPSEVACGTQHMFEVIRADLCTGALYMGTLCTPSACALCTPSAWAPSARRTRLRSEGAVKGCQSACSLLHGHRLWLLKAALGTNTVERSPKSPGLSQQPEFGFPESPSLNHPPRTFLTSRFPGHTSLEPLPWANAAAGNQLLRTYLGPWN
eukprot:51368-Chlamydomonas_euryale.AAC.1